MSRIKGSKGHPRTPEAIAKFKATVARKKLEREAALAMEQKLASPKIRTYVAKRKLDDYYGRKLETVNRLLALMERILENDNAQK